MAIKSRAKCTRTVGMDLSARARSRRDSVQGRQQGAGAAARGRLSNFAPPGAPRPFPCEYVPGTPVRCLGCRVINIGCEYVPENVRKLRLRLTAVCHRAGRCWPVAVVSELWPIAQSSDVRASANCKHHLATVYLKQLHRRALAAAFKGGLVIAPEHDRYRRNDVLRMRLYILMSSSSLT